MVIPPPPADSEMPITQRADREHHSYRISYSQVSVWPAKMSQQALKRGGSECVPSLHSVPSVCRLRTPWDLENGTTSSLRPSSGCTLNSGGRRIGHGAAPWLSNQNPIPLPRSSGQLRQNEGVRFTLTTLLLPNPDSTTVTRRHERRKCASRSAGLMRMPYELAR